MKTRKEFDSIGGINVPSDKYWGASTQRSKKYFDVGDFLFRLGEENAWILCLFGAFKRDLPIFLQSEIEALPWRN